MKMKHKRG